LVKLVFGQKRVRDFSKLATHR